MFRPLKPDCFNSRRPPHPALSPLGERGNEAGTVRVAPMRVRGRRVASVQNDRAPTEEKPMTAFDSTGAVGGVRGLLRLEGLALFAAALLFYSQAGAPWKMF